MAVLEEALGTYQKRLKELDLRGHLRDLLNGQLHRVTDLLDSTSAPSVPTIMKQVKTLETILENRDIGILEKPTPSLI